MSVEKYIEDYKKHLEAELYYLRKSREARANGDKKYDIHYWNVSASINNNYLNPLRKILETFGVDTFSIDKEFYEKIVKKEMKKNEG